MPKTKKETTQKGMPFNEILEFVGAQSLELEYTRRQNHKLRALLVDIRKTLIKKQAPK